MAEDVDYDLDFKSPALKAFANKFLNFFEKMDGQIDAFKELIEVHKEEVAEKEEEIKEKDDEIKTLEEENGLNFIILTDIGSVGVHIPEQNLVYQEIIEYMERIVCPTGKGGAYLRSVLQAIVKKENL